MMLTKMGRKKKEVEIGTFTIVSKAPKGCKRNVVYTVTYQRSGEPETFNVKMVWLDFRDTPTWAFMDGKEADLLTNEERKEFIEEFIETSLNNLLILYLLCKDYMELLTNGIKRK